MQADEQERPCASKRLQRRDSRLHRLAEVLKSSGVDPARARTLFKFYQEQELVRVSEDLVFHALAIES